MNVTSDIEQILEATHHAIRAVRPLTTYLKKHRRKTNIVCGKLLEKQGELRSDVFLWTPTRERPARSYCWTLSKNLPTSGLCGHRMYLGKSAGRVRLMIGTDGECLDKQCKQRDLIVYIYIYIYI